VEEKIINTLLKRILLFSGFLSLFLGILGVFLPLLPTTPFLLLSAACFSRSSDRFYKKLMGNRWLGFYIKNYLEGNGIPLREKMLSITLLWITIGYSTVFLISNSTIKILLLIIALGVTLHVISLKTLHLR
jgi:uncharacterized protein